MIRVFVATVFLGWLVFPALAASLDAAAINNAGYSSKLSTDSIEAAAIKVQVLLDRAQFSPGEIDGKLGENVQKALKAFAEAKGLTPSDKGLNEDVWKALVATGADAAIVEYKIAESDVKGPFLEKLPAKMDDMKEPQGARLHQSARGPRREISHERRAAGGAEPQQEVRSRPAKPFSSPTLLEQASQVDDRPRRGRQGTARPSRRSTPRARWSRSFPATVGSEEKPTPTRQPQGRLRRCQPELPL